MQKEVVILLIDSNEGDRNLVKSILAGKCDRFIEAENATAAWEVTRGIGTITLMVAGIDGEAAGEIFELRDFLHRETGFFPSAFCSHEDMTPHYPRVLEGERLFFKPVNRGVLLEWFESLGAGASDESAGSEPTAHNEPVSGAIPEIATEPAREAVLENFNPPSETAPVSLPEEALPVGTRLGDYKLLREIQRDADFALYEAEQTSIGRRVALKTLYRKHRKDIHWVQGFVNEASARASVNHPAISLVYECDQEMGVNFYTLELVDAPSLSDLSRRRAELDDAVLWKVLASAASALAYLRDHGMTHRLFTAQSILIVKGAEPRIANPVRGRGLPLSPDEERRQMELLAEAIQPFLKRSSSDPALFSLVDRMATDRIDGVNSIEALRKALNPPDPKEGLSQSELAKMTEKETNRTAIVTGSIIGILIVAAAIIALLVTQKPERRELEGLAKIPAGKFPFQNESEVELPDFWIGRYEVTIAEYADFLADIKAHPDKVAKIKHPEQPPEKTSYEPENWAAYLDAANRGRSFLGGKVDPNYPVTGVDFWDAHAYAAWRGGRLPTEQEWEKAGRGRAGSVYPWGDNLENANFNGGIDHESKDDVAAGSVDGYRYWAPVDGMPLDESRYGVVGLAGNVSEWTATWDAHPDHPDRKVPLKRGASFATTAGFELTARRAADSASERNYLTGFRIASDQETLPTSATAPVAAPASSPAPETPIPAAPEPAPVDPAPAPAPAPAPGN